MDIKGGAIDTTILVVPIRPTKDGNNRVGR